MAAPRRIGAETFLQFSQGEKRRFNKIERPVWRISRCVALWRFYSRSAEDIDPRLRFVMENRIWIGFLNFRP
jgi:hypothetical protein